MCKRLVSVLLLVLLAGCGDDKDACADRDTSPPVPFPHAML